ncbi:kinase-like protein [Marasmius fiardii PR-910]|nr:kinase-like protein [Marasmius fiardii PR-910]
MSSGKNMPRMNKPATHLTVGRDYKGSDRIGNIGTQNNSRVKHTVNGTGHSINHGRDQNVNNGTGTFSVNHGAQNPYDNGHGSRGENQTPEPRDDDKNPFRQIKPTIPSSTRSDTEILERMRVVLGDENLLNQFLGSRERKAEMALDGLQRASYLPECEPTLRSELLYLMSQLSEASGRYVPCHYNPTVQKLGNGPVSPKPGGSLQVWKGKIGGSSETVALKVVRSESVAEVGEKLKVHMREIVKWRLVDHSKVVPFIGTFCFGENKEEICLVSPWMENGSVVEYLEKNHTKTLERFSFSWDVASGLEYLHSMGIVHGNLKGDNVMITPHGLACITDYGLVPLINSGGNIRPTPWCAREVLVEKSFSEKSDTYAFGFLCYEIFVGRIPFRDMNENELRKAIVEQKLQPDRPKVNEPMPWEVMQWCWSANPTSRPSATDVLKNLGEMGASLSEQNSDDPFC